MKMIGDAVQALHGVGMMYDNKQKTRAEHLMIHGALYRSAICFASLRSSHLPNFCAVKKARRDPEAYGIINPYADQNIDTPPPRPPYFVQGAADEAGTAAAEAGDAERVVDEAAVAAEAGAAERVADEAAVAAEAGAAERVADEAAVAAEAGAAERVADEAAVAAEAGAAERVADEAAAAAEAGGAAERVADEAAERDPSAYEGAAEEETRIAPDGHAYTKLEFETFFGGLVEWNNANMQTSKKRKRKNKDRVAPSPPASRGMMYEDLHLARIMAGQDPGHGADDEPEDDVDMDGGGGLRHCQFIDHEADTRMPRPIRVTIGKPGKGSKKGRLIAKRVGAAAKKADAADERQAKAAAKKAEKAAKAAAKEAEKAAKAAAKEAEKADKAAAKEAKTAAKAAKGAKQAPAKVASKNTEEKAASASDEAKIICADCFETFAAEEMVTHGSFFVCKSQEECQSRVCSRGRGIKRTCRRT